MKYFIILCRVKVKNLTKYVVPCKRTYFARNSVVLLRTLATRGAIIIMDAYTSVFAGMICIGRATIFVYWFWNWCITFSWCFNVLIPLFVWKANRNILCIIKFQVIKNNFANKQTFLILQILPLLHPGVQGWSMQYSATDFPMLHAKQDAVNARQHARVVP